VVNIGADFTKHHYDSSNTFGSIN